ncbi:MAG: hypothetical protein ACTHL8_12150 [Burkholderiaceae bacterium]
MRRDLALHRSCSGRTTEREAGRTVIQITEDQLAAIELHMDERYRRELVADFRRQHPEHTAAMSDERLRAIIDRSLTDARARGIASSGALLRYVSLSVLVSPDFESVPQVKAMFDAPGLDVEYKVHLLSDMLIAQLREV